MKTNSKDIDPITVRNITEQDISIAGILIKAGEAKENFPAGLIKTVRKREGLVIDGEVPEEVRSTNIPSRSPIKYGVEPEEGISIVVPVLNRPDMLIRCCESILASSYTEYEVIVSDDGSNPDCLDAAKDLAKRFQHNNTGFVYTYSSLNQGIAAARNIGVAIAKYDLILNLDSDDEIEKDALHTFADTFKDTRADVIYGSTYMMKDGRREKRDAPEWALGKLRKHGCYILGPRCISKKALMYVSYFDEFFKRAEDLDVLIRIEEAGGLFVKLDKVIGTIHLHGDSATQKEKKDVGIFAGIARGNLKRS